MNMAMTIQDKPWDKDLQLMLVFVIGFNVIPHATIQPLWVTAVAFICLFWKVLYLSKGVVRPSRWILNIAAAVLSGLLFLEYQTLFGQEPAGALLVILTGLKLLETNRYRDTMLVIFTCYFLLMTHLLESQSLLSTSFMIGDVLLITVLMFQIHKKDRRRSLRTLIPTMRLLALTIPVWIMLFFAFPRFSTSLWNMGASGAQTGFSDEMDPGSVASLAENEEIAMRVVFNNNRTPSLENLYWRGGVLSVADGLKWSRSEIQSRLPLEQAIENDSPAKGSLISYQVFLEPGFNKWLFVLEHGASIRSSDRNRFFGIRRKHGYFFETSNPIQNRIAYRSDAEPQMPLQTIGESEQKLNLQNPKDLDEQILRLAQKLKNRAENRERAANVSLEKQMATEVIDWFHDENFRYTREPGALRSTKPTEQLSQFLFESKKGFCEHYAAALATLLRLMNVPSRVVIGFQGGQPNEFGSYLLVRQMDAHAWTEYFETAPGATLEGERKGRWVRVDATAVIAPLRLQLGGNYNLLDSNSLVAGFTSDELRRQLNSGAGGMIMKASLAWDSLQMRWNSFLVSYDFEYQKELLKNFGLEKISWFGQFASIVILLGLIAFFWSRLLKKKAGGEDASVLEWRRFCNSMEKAGLKRGKNEGPLAYSERVAAQYPELATEIQTVALNYIQLRYGKTADGEKRKLWRTFRQSVRRFSIKANSRPVVS